MTLLHTSPDLTPESVPSRPKVVLPNFLRRSATPSSPPSCVRSQAREDDDEAISEKPMSKSKSRNDDEEEELPVKRSSGNVQKGMATGMIITIVGVVVGAGGCCCVSVMGLIVVALLVPAVQKVRDAASRTQSTNNLRLIGLGFHAYNDQHKRLPFNGSDQAVGGVTYSTTAAKGNAASGSWAFQILPFVDQGFMFDNLDRSKGIAAYMCPKRGRPLLETSNGGGTWTDYFLNGYLNDPINGKPDAPDRKLILDRIPDGTSLTILVGHGNINLSQYSSSSDVTLSTNIFKGGTAGTMRSGGATQEGRDPREVTLKLDSTNAPVIGSWGGPFTQGGLMGMGDGSVRLFSYNTTQFGAFLTPAGGEQVFLPFN
jgi:Protein of unknown function (DUF1559)